MKLTDVSAADGQAVASVVRLFDGCGRMTSYPRDTVAGTQIDLFWRWLNPLHRDEWRARAAKLERRLDHAEV